MTHAQELERGERFEFGENWTQFLQVLDDERVRNARESLQNMLGVDTLTGKSFLDIGSGSGLFSLVARQLGARVHSFDYDPKSVACAQELRRRYFPGDSQWTVQEGSVLDEDYVASLGRFDIVYSWGVLHHTGSMWKALENAKLAVADEGTLFIAIYNDQGYISRNWKRVKQIYCSGALGRSAMKLAFYGYFGLGRLVADLRHRRNPFTSYGVYKATRGMSVLHDWRDWLGGYPFEVAKPEDIFDFYHRDGFVLERLKTCGGGLGCNEFVFVRRMDGAVAGRPA